MSDFSCKELSASGRRTSLMATKLYIRDFPPKKTMMIPLPMSGCNDCKVSLKPIHLSALKVSLYHLFSFRHAGCHKIHAPSMTPPARTAYPASRAAASCSSATCQGSARAPWSPSSMTPSRRTTASSGRENFNLLPPRGQH